MATSLPPDSPRSEQPPSGEKQNYNPEVWHLRFRGFSPSKRASPDQCLKQISELCYQWLRPDLNSKEEILDQLVLEQFMISMPPQLQALVKESGVTSCKDLEKILRDHRKPRSWSIVNWKGRLYLRRDPRVEKAEAKEDEWDDKKLSQKHVSNQEEPPNRGQGSSALWNLSSETEEPSTSKALVSQRGFNKMEKAKAGEWDDWDKDVVVVSGDSPSSCYSSLEFQNLSGTEPSSVRQKEKALLKKVPVRKGLDCPRPEQSPRSDSVRDGDKASVFVPQGPQPAQGPGAYKKKRDEAASTDPQSLCSSSGDLAPACQAGASGVDHTENRPLAVAALEHLPGQARFECSECRRGFLYRAQFIIHQRSHTGERPSECPLCNRGFLQSSDLRVRQRTHTGEKPYVCRVCSKVLAHESTLLGHSRVHPKEKPYACEYCGKFFSHKGNLSIHLRIHSDSKPYICAEYYTAFRQRHVKTHSRVAPV